MNRHGRPRSAPAHPTSRRYPGIFEAILAVAAASGWPRASCARCNPSARSCCAAPSPYRTLATSSSSRCSPRRIDMHCASKSPSRSSGVLNVRQNQPQQFAVELATPRQSESAESACLPDKSRARAASNPDSFRRHRRDARDSPHKMPVSLPPFTKTPDTAVMSGKCVPPRNGSLTMRHIARLRDRRPPSRAALTTASRQDAPACDRPSPPFRRRHRTPRTNNRAAL